MIPFTKMQGTGNDYIYLNGFERNFPAPEKLAIQLSRRHYSIGSDGLVIILPSQVADCRMEMYNADGSSSPICGNALRCVGKFIYDRGYTSKLNLSIDTDAGLRDIQLIHNQQEVIHKARVNMGVPIWDNDSIPIYWANNLSPMAGKSVSLSLTLMDILSKDKTEINSILTEKRLSHNRSFLKHSYLKPLSMGNPHGVVILEKPLSDDEFNLLGPLLSTSSLFHEGANIEFVVINSPERIEMRVWERGSGETLACGSGACAAFAVARKTNLVHSKICCSLKGGLLELEEHTDGSIYMTGDCMMIYHGEVHI